MIHACEPCELFKDRTKWVEQKHGQWVMDDYTHRYRCSVCEAYRPYDTVGDYIDYWDCDYCPICGAKMEG